MMAGTNTTSSGFSFGQPQTSTTATMSKSFFSAPLSTPTAGGFGFGNPSTTTVTSSISNPSATAASTPGSFNFGGILGGSSSGINPTTTPSTAGGFSFGTTPIASSSGTLNLSSAPATTSSTGFALGVTAPTPASSTTAGFSFGILGSTPASSSSGFSFSNAGGTPAVSTSTGFSLSGGLGGVQTSKSPLFGFSGPTATPAQATSASTCMGNIGGVGIGLGGVQAPSANADSSSVGSKADGKSTKDQQLSQDLFTTLAVFESRRNAENSASEENIRQTAAPFHKVGKKAGEIQQQLAELASEYLQLHASAVNLKAEVMKEAEHVEMARRTKDTPMALQGENKAPEVFFINLVRSFEAEMMYCRTKIEEVSQCMQAASNPCETPDDIAEVLQREHDTLKELAAKVYSRHAQLVELGQRLNTKIMPNEQAFFRPQSKEDTKTPASAVVRPVLGGSSSGLQAFQEEQQRAKAVTFGAAPPTLPLAQSTTPSLFGNNSNTSSIFSTGGTPFGTSSFNLGSSTGSSSFGTKPLFGATSSPFGNTTAFGTNTSGIQQSTSPFAISSPFSTKPFDEDADGRRKRRM